MKNHGFLDLTEEEISERLSQDSITTHEFDFPIELFQESPKPAAVLIPFLRKDNSWHILYTRRTDTLPEHSGQVAFPGGRTDPEDISPEATAIREAYEEIRLKPSDVKILGRMHSIATITNYFVTPIIGVIPWPYNFVLRKEEVSKVFMIPMEWLSDPRNHSIQERKLPKPYPPIPVVYFERYNGELLWGVSARITLNLLDTLKIFS
jgi:8-oxo-dGTP pyrophosphatase MutT (NUDIX family)